MLALLLLLLKLPDFLRPARPAGPEGRWPERRLTKKDKKQVELALCTGLCNGDKIKMKRENIDARSLTNETPQASAVYLLT